MAPPHVKPRFYSERASHVFPAGLPFKSSLGNRLSITIKAVQNGQFSLGSKATGDFVGLIETALPLSPMVERHRHQGIPFLVAGMVVKCLSQPLDQLRIVIIVVAVLEPD